jgi:hypothetical protein
MLSIGRTATPHGTGVSSEGSPPADLERIQFRQTPTHPVATIPLKPAALVGIPARITQKSMIMVICATPTGSRGRPAILAPHGQRLTRLDAEQIHGGIGALGRQLPIVDRRRKPLRGKLGNTVIEIAALECAEHQDFARGQIRLELCGEITWCRVQGIAVGTVPPKTDALDAISALE